jgi:prevent-host-death family protein
MGTPNRLCPNCGGELKIIAAILETPIVIEAGGACASKPLTLLRPRHRAILVSMTRKLPAQSAVPAQVQRSRWRLQDAKARFSELVRLAHSDGPQLVTLHGRDAVVVVDADEFHRLKGERTGQLLVDALQASPHRDIEVEPRRSAMPVRAVKL